MFSVGEGQILYVSNHAVAIAAVRGFALFSGNIQNLP